MYYYKPAPSILDVIKNVFRQVCLKIYSNLKFFEEDNTMKAWYVYIRW